MAKGLLLVAFDFTNAHEDEFHDWYDLEHIPERQRVAGFGLCERWIHGTNPRQAVIDRAWGAALSLVTIILILNLIARIVSRRSRMA